MRRAGLPATVGRSWFVAYPGTRRPPLLLSSRTAKEQSANTGRPRRSDPMFVWFQQGPT
jgi:hypothetical protein